MQAAVAKFQQRRTYTENTVGRKPNAAGDVNDWSTVTRESPAPMKFTLVSIEELFTEKYFAHPVRMVYFPLITSPTRIFFL